MCLEPVVLFLPTPIIYRDSQYGQKEANKFWLLCLFCSYAFSTCRRLYSLYDRWKTGWTQKWEEIMIISEDKTNKYSKKRTTNRIRKKKSICRIKKENNFNEKASKYTNLTFNLHFPLIQNSCKIIYVTKSQGHLACCPIIPSIKPVLPCITLDNLCSWCTGMSFVCMWQVKGNWRPRSFMKCIDCGPKQH